ncbi:MAG: hypothetical protein HFE88_04545 [Acutalibacter sp.]|nr:hypothetical protein [Acutalibacter sp.]
MTKQNFLEALCAFTRETLKDLILPVEMQEEDEEPPAPRAPEVHEMGLPDYTSAEKKLPYVIHQVITAKDVWPAGQQPKSHVVVRSVFGVYHPDSQEGPLALLGMIERIRLGFWRQRVIGKQFKLDVTQGLEYLIYEKQFPPYYAGEMLSTWELTPIELEVKKHGSKGYSNIQIGPQGRP